MKIGCGAGIDLISVVKSAGCDYIELNLAELNQLSEEKFQDVLNQLAEEELEVLAVNCFLPGDWPLSRSGYDRTANREYLKRAAGRLHQMGCPIAVLGSGGARRLDTEYGEELGKAQFAEFYRDALGIFSAYDIRVVIEHLNSRECNFINTLKEASEVALSASPEGAVLCDFYHFVQENEPFEDFEKISAPILHCHIANPIDRAVPLPDDGIDYKPYREVLDKLGYTGNLSIEADWNTFEQFQQSVAYLKTVFG